MRRRFFVMFNPGAGKSRRALLDDVVARLHAAGASVTWCQATDASAARDEAAGHICAGACDAVIAAGGDGTIRQAASVVANTDMPLGFVPLGTGNVLAHEVGLDRAPDALADTLLNGPLLPIECARANGELFVLMAGAGFDGHVMAALKSATKLRIGKAAYVAPVLASLARPLDQLQVTVDGTARDATWTVIANARHYGGGFVIAPGTSLRETGLHAVLFRSRSRVVLLRQLLALGMGTLRDAGHDTGDVSMIPCRHVSVRSTVPVACQIDGDTFGATPLDVSYDGGTVQLIVPTRGVAV